jgi:hypothetical protein
MPTLKRLIESITNYAKKVRLRRLLIEGENSGIARYDYDSFMAELDKQSYKNKTSKPKS